MLFQRVTLARSNLWAKFEQINKLFWLYYIQWKLLWKIKITLNWTLSSGIFITIAVLFKILYFALHPSDKHFISYASERGDKKNLIFHALPHSSLTHFISNSYLPCTFTVQTTICNHNKVAPDTVQEGDAFVSHGCSFFTTSLKVWCYLLLDERASLTNRRFRRYESVDEREYSPFFLPPSSIHSIHSIHTYFFPYIHHPRLRIFCFEQISRNRNNS